MSAIELQPVFCVGQIKTGDVLLINDGRVTFPVEVKSVFNRGMGEEEILISKSKNIYFIVSMVLEGTSWVKAASIIKSGRIFSYSNTMKDYHNDRN